MYYVLDRRAAEPDRIPRRPRGDSGRAGEASTTIRAVPHERATPPANTPNTSDQSDIVRPAAGSASSGIRARVISGATRRCSPCDAADRREWGKWGKWGGLTIRFHSSPASPRTFRPRPMQRLHRFIERSSIIRQIHRLVRPDIDNKIIRPRQVVLRQAQRLPQQPPYAVALHRRSNLSRHGHPQPRMIHIIRPAMNHQRAHPHPRLGVVHRPKLLTARQPHPPREAAGQTTAIFSIQGQR